MRTTAISFLKLAVFFSLTLLAACNSGRQKNGNTPSGNDHEISDDSLLTLVQYRTFQYFWEGAEPNSGLARERLHMDDIYPQDDKHIVTTGGSGFGLMAILVGVERGFITREEAFQRFQKIIDFLEKADRFHGAWPHWLNGETGKVKPFSQYDDGGDLVETAFLVQGLLAVKQYFVDGNEDEQQLAQKIDQLWREVEWDWYTKGGEDILYWHWSPNHGWKMNFGVTGYNECMVMYILAASSPTHPVDPEVYHQGWAMNGDISGEYTTFGHTLPLKQHVDPRKGGPLFWAHYSWLGLDPRGLSDQYANYWDNNVAHTLINRQHCINNPNNYAGYGEDAWGLTSSYSVPGAAAFVRGQSDEKPESGNSQQTGYAGHRPSFDLGVVTPTAALSSMPYAPEKVLSVIRHFYEDLGDEIWGVYGFYDAFSEEYEWYPKRYLAIDQGPIPVMIENHRTGLLWELFMQEEDVQQGLKELGFTSPHISIDR
ncbi:glucoamylase family protein [Marinilabilia salmonicolor]|uniref:glucoamylase family protein n=1 Tax=Marinilabilia salmonicolor TaxID=989 RepID=UPI00029AD3F5|nr:glucoamylase family protein [Marinilabilia salmonicolor]